MLVNCWLLRHGAPQTKTTENVNWCYNLLLRLLLLFKIVLKPKGILRRDRLALKIESAEIWLLLNRLNLLGEVKAAKHRRLLLCLIN